MTEEKIYKFDNRARNRKIVKCSHQNDKDELTADPFNDRGDVRCTQCGMEFNMNPIDSDDLKNAIKIIRDAGNHIKTLMYPEDDMDMIKQLGIDGFNVHETGIIYARIMRSLNVDGYDDYEKDRSSVSFIGGRK